MYKLCKFQLSMMFGSNFTGGGGTPPVLPLEKKAQCLMVNVCRASFVYSCHSILEDTIVLFQRMYHTGNARIFLR